MRDSVPFHQRYLQTRYFAALDGLRCVSILWVIGFHAKLSNPVLARLFRRGDWGVGLFFAISGFLITTLLLREKSQRGTISLSNFYARRTLRIFPLYYAAICVYTLLVWRVEHGQERAEYFSHLPFFLTYTGNWFVDRFAADRVIFAFSWTLATEEQFYLVWPSIVRFAKRDVAPFAVISVALCVAIVFDSLAALGHLHLGTTGNRIATSIATPICLGCMLAYGLHWRTSFERLRLVLGHRLSAPAAAIGVAALYVLLIFTSADSRTEFWLDATMVPAAVLLVGACCIREDHYLRPLLANAVVRYVGTISYGIYLLHMLAINAAKKLVHSRGNEFFALSVCLSVLLASVSFWFYERQFLKLKSRFTSPVRNEPVKPELEPAAVASGESPVAAHAFAAAKLI